MFTNIALTAVLFGGPWRGNHFKVYPFKVRLITGKARGTFSPLVK